MRGKEISIITLSEMMTLNFLQEARANPTANYENVGLILLKLISSPRG